MIKKAVLSAVAFLWCAGAFAQGVEFRDITFGQALEAARSEGKPVFLDCYTVWCGPCKYMAEHVFTLPAAGEWFNARFVNIKIDMEKGEGVELAKKYGVEIFPTFLIIGADGRELHRVSGSGDLNDFIARVDVGLRAKKSLAALAKEYGRGRMGTADMTDYWLLLRAVADRRAGEVGDRLYATLTPDEKLRGVYWPVLRGKAATPDSEGMQFILANRAALEASNGKDIVDKHIYDVFSKAIAAADHGRVHELAEHISALYGDTGTRLIYLAALVDARLHEDAEMYVAAMENGAGAVPVDMTLTAFGDAKTMTDGKREYYPRLRRIASELLTLAEDRSHRARLENLVAQFGRRDHTGVFWEEFDSLDDALAQAMREEYRPVFLYLYMGAPDGIMATEAVGDIANKHFVNVKYDMASGVGAELARQFEVAEPAVVIVESGRRVRETIAPVDGSLAEKIRR